MSKSNPINQPAKTRKTISGLGGPGSRFVSVPTASLERFLSSKGFRPSQSGNERSMILANHKGETEVMPGGVALKVLTSAEVGSKNARGLGEDAIRVYVLICGGRENEQDEVTPPRVWNDSKLESQRVFRTGSVEGVLERLQSRIDEAKKGAEAKYGTHRCPACKASTWKDSRKCVNRQCSTNLPARGNLSDQVTLPAKGNINNGGSQDSVFATKAQKEYIVLLCKQQNKPYPHEIETMTKQEARVLIDSMVRPGTKQGWAK